MSQRNIAVAIREGSLALDVAGVIDVLSDANTLLDAGNCYRVFLVAKDRAPIRSSNGMRLIPDLNYAEATVAFTAVLVIGSPGDPDLKRDDALCTWLHDVVPRAEHYGSSCTGAFAIGHAGLLDGRVATTHWLHAPQLASLFPQATVERDRICIRDDRLITAAGATAGIDLALALVAQHHGSKTALAVAKRLVVVARCQGGQPHFSPYLTAPTREESPVERILAHVIGNIGQSLRVDALARNAGMSPRNLARLFVQDTGVTPHEFVARARIDAARNLLEGSSKPLKVIAHDCGFGSANQMRAVFMKQLGTSPSHYRNAFQYRNQDARPAGRPAGIQGCVRQAQQALFV